MKDVPDVLLACLCRGVKVYPYEIELLVERSKSFPVPYKIMIDKAFDLEEYTDAIQYSSEQAG